MRLSIPTYHDLSSKSIPIKTTHVIKTNSFFDILKKIYSLTIDLLQTSTYWLSRIKKYLPIIGLLIGLASIGLQTVMAIADKKRTWREKGGFIALFLAITCLTVVSIITLSPLPALAIITSLCIIAIHNLIDSMNLFTQYQEHTKRKEKQGYMHRLDAQELDRQIDEYEKQLFGQSKNHLSYKKLSEDDKRTINKLYTLYQQKTDPQYKIEKGQRKIKTQSKQLYFGSLSLSISFINTVLVITGIICTGLNPLVITSLLALTFAIDLTELIVNVCKLCYRKKQKIKQGKEHKAFYSEYFKEKDFLNQPTQLLSTFNKKTLSRKKEGAPNKAPPVRQTVSMPSLHRLTFFKAVPTSDRAVLSGELTLQP